MRPVSSTPPRSRSSYQTRYNGHPRNDTRTSTHKGRPSNSPRNSPRRRRSKQSPNHHSPAIKRRYIQKKPCFPDAPMLDANIFAYMLQYIDPYDLTRTVGHVCKTWLEKSRSRCSADIWKLVILAKQRSPLAVANSCEWLKNSGILNYVKDLNIAMSIDLEQMRALSAVYFPNIREVSVNLDDSPITMAQYVVFLLKHPHIQWINAEFSTREQSQKAILPLEVVPNLKCIGVERVYVQGFDDQLGCYPKLLALGHVRVFDEYFSSLSNMFHCCPNLRALSVSVDAVTSGLTTRLAEGKNLEVLYVFSNLDLDDFGSFDNVDWWPLRSLKNLKSIMLVNFPDSWTRKVRKVCRLSGDSVTKQASGLSFWVQVENGVNGRWSQESETNGTD